MTTPQQGQGTPGQKDKLQPQDESLKKGAVAPLAEDTKKNKEEAEKMEMDKPKTEWKPFSDHPEAVNQGLPTEEPEEDTDEDIKRHQDLGGVL